MFHVAEATKLFDDPDYVPKPAKLPQALRDRHEQAISALRGRDGAARLKRRVTRVQITLEPRLLRGAGRAAMGCMTKRIEHLEPLPVAGEADRSILLCISSA